METAPPHNACAKRPQAAQAHSVTPGLRQVAAGGAAAAFPLPPSPSGAPLRWCCAVLRWAAGGAAAGSAALAGSVGGCWGSTVPPDDSPRAAAGRDRAAALRSQECGEGAAQAKGKTSPA